MALHPIIEQAAAGVLPVWSATTSTRLAHMQRVASLMGSWADELAISPVERARWRAVGLLHDALREVSPEELRPTVGAELQALPGKLLHGPAAAARLRAEGIRDAPLLCAITYHTVGHPDLDEMGRALFIADYIEPGRTYDTARLESWRVRMPTERDAVVRAVLRARIDRLLNEARPIRNETASFWNALTGQT